MRVIGFDERGYGWEGQDPTFHVSLFEDCGESWAEDSYELSDCGALDAIRWAQEHVLPGGAWALGLVAVIPDALGNPTRGYTHLEGYDLNAPSASLEGWRRSQVEAMLGRRDKSVVLAAPVIEERP